MIAVGAAESQTAVKFNELAFEAKPAARSPRRIA